MRVYGRGSFGPVGLVRRRQMEGPKRGSAGRWAGRSTRQDAAQHSGNRDPHQPCPALARGTLVWCHAGVVRGVHQPRPPPHPRLQLSATR